MPLSWEGGVVAVESLIGSSILESISWSESYSSRTRRNMSSSKPEMNSMPLSRTIDFNADDLLHVSNIQGRRFQSVLKVNFKHVYTVDQLKKVISSRHGLSVVALLYRGVCLADDHKLAHLIPDLQNMGAPRFSVRTRVHTQSKSGGIFLRVKGLEGSSFLVHLTAQSSVADLVSAITDYEAYSSDQDIQITCAGKSLSDLDSSLALKKCNLVSGSVVHVVGKLRGGGLNVPVQTFVDMENMYALKSCAVVVFKPGRPIWVSIRRGLNVQGTCRNSFCEAFGKTVYCPKGFVVFNIAEIVHCPACGSVVTATTVGFYKCQWMFEGRKSGITAIDMMSKWQVTNGENEYQWFDDEEGRNTANWCSLVITAKELLTDDIDWKDCAICFGTLTAGLLISFNIDMACGHRAHSHCRARLQDCGYTTCPTCRNPMVA